MRKGVKNVKNPTTDAPATVNEMLDAEDICCRNVRKVFDIYCYVAD